MLRATATPLQLPKLRGSLTPQQEISRGNIQKASQLNRRVPSDDDSSFCGYGQLSLFYEVLASLDQQ